MNGVQANCDPQRIEQFLRQQLSEEEQASFEAHLDGCRDCRLRLEQAAGDEGVWLGVRDSLRDQPRPGAGPLDSAGPLDAAESSAGLEPTFNQDSVLKLLAPTDDDRMLGRLGTYEVVGVVGTGGMGVVLKAFEAALNRYVAIKVQSPHLASSGAARKRFAREAQAAAAVVHDNVMEIYGVADVQGLPYLVMPYLRGPSLQRRLDDDGPLAVVEILRIGMQAASGLAAAHAQGLVHRDVKPANILLADGVERVKLTDFGLARAADDASLTRTGIIAGTPQYMSPEQARGEAVDRRSDLFSLGSVLYAMCTGRAPFRAETSYGVLRRVTDEQPRPICEINPQIPEWLCRVVDRLMSKRPDERYGTAREVAELLEQCLAHVQQPTAVRLPVSLSAGADRGRRPSISLRRRGAKIMLAVLGMGLLGVFLWQGKDGAQENAGRSAPAGAPSVAAAPKAAPVMAPKRLRRFSDLATGHNTTVALSPDGKVIALANSNPTLVMLGGGRSEPADGWKATVDLLDAVTGKTLASLPLLTKDEAAIVAATPRISHVQAEGLAFSPDGTLVAVGTSIGQVKLFDAKTGELVRTLDDETARLADKAAPADWKPLGRAQGSVADLKFSPDGNLLAACGTSFADFASHFTGVERMGFRTSGPGRLKLWEVATGKLKHDLPGHNDQAYAVAFSPDGTKLASAGRWNSSVERFGNGVILWSVETGEAIHTLIRSTANAGVRSIAFSPDGKRLALGTQRFNDDGEEQKSTGGVSLVRVSSAVEDWLVTVPGWAKALTFSADGSQLLVLCGKSIRSLDAAEGTTHYEIQPDGANGESRWSDFAFSPKHDLLAITGVDKASKGSVEVWGRPGRDESAGAPAASAPTEPGQGKKEEGRRDRVFNLGSPVQLVAASENGKWIAAANGNPTFDGPPSRTTLKNQWKPTVEILDYPSGKTVASPAVTTADEEAALATIDQISHVEVTALALSADGDLLAVGTSLGQVKLFGCENGELVRSLDDEREKRADEITPEKLRALPRAMGSITALVFSPDGTQLAVCGNSMSDFARVFQGKQRQGELTTGPGRLKVWNVADGSLQHDLAGHNRATAVAWSPDGKLLASAGRWHEQATFGTGVILWNSEDGKTLRTIATESGGTSHSLEFSQNGALLAISELHPDVDRTLDASTTTISLAQVNSGAVKWRRTISGSARPVVHYAESLIVLTEHNALRILQRETGETQAILSRTFDVHEPGRWNDLALAKRGNMWVIAGEDAKGGGMVSVIDSAEK